jgi:thymidylate synthase (FAD)
MAEYKVLDHGYVRLIESWGSDAGIIEAARMSTSGSFRGWDTDARLLRYLWEHKHHSPFEMGGATVEVQAPIFVFREWHRHRTQSFNELSARYTELPDLFYTPSIERLMNGKQSSKNKQGSEEGFTRSEAVDLQADIISVNEYARRCYESHLKKGVSREIARLVIPVNQYSRMRASANLRNWLGFLSLRCANGAQWEIRQYAQAVSDIIKESFPRTHELFMEDMNGKG